MTSKHPSRFVLLALAGLSLLTGLWGGVVRLGWGLPLLRGDLVEFHGPLMVVGFLGTLISLERAVALQRLWAFGAPVFSGLSVLVLLAGLPLTWGHILAEMGSLFLISILVFLYCQRPSGYFAIIGLGALLWFVGNLLWHAGYPIHRVVPWWAGFLVLTIAGERLELARLMRLSTISRAVFFAACAVFLTGLVVSLLVFDAGVRLGGIGLAALALWLFRYDMARRTIQETGLPRFMAVCLLSGYAWLVIGSFLWIVFADRFVAGPHYDAMLHTIFLGFVFSMIFAHAPIIFPSITGLEMSFQRAFYGHFALLHFSLLIRVVGDMGGWISLQRWGGLLNVLTLLLFLANNVRSVRYSLAETSK